MKAIVLREYGGPEMLRFEEVATPEPKPGEILIKVRNVSVNVTLDIILRKGLYPMKPTLPHVMGTDPVGEIVALGGGLSKDFKIGDRVAVHTPMTSPDCVPGQEADDPGIDRLFGIHCWGGYAEYAAIPEANAFPIPENLSYPEATVIMRHLPTARHMLYRKAELKEGEWVLIMGATGGLASCCVQVAKRMGATVIAAAGADDRVQKAIDIFGADHGINYRSQDLAAEVMELTGGRGVNVVTDSIGDAELWPGAMGSLGKLGRLVTAGAHGGGQVALNLRMMYIKRQRIIGTPGCDFADIEWALNAARDGSILAPIVDRIMPLHEAAQAHKLVEGRVPVGKLLLDPTLSADHPAGD
ncbi:MAG: zinc-binding dehydrogenase [Rhodospirillales bacterium]|nr:zinc-binding dehydrogenase [Rhodospirillales bacterium]